MKIVFSRKGFDSKAGGCASPIVDGRPISLPIPAVRSEITRYADLGLGPLVEHVTRGRIRGEHACHHDPYFAGPCCALGQIGAAQTHLTNHGVGPGDLFLFFGLFRDDGGPAHHRIFGYLAVEAVIALGAEPDAAGVPAFARGHPHLSGRWPANNTLYTGEGAAARSAPDLLRLSTAGKRASRWQVPAWLEKAGLSYHRDPARWCEPPLLDVVAQGQEFVAEPGDDRDARRWACDVIAAIRGAC